MSDETVTVIVAVLFISLFGGLLYIVHQGDLAKQETIITLVSKGVPVLEATCAARAD